MEMQYSDSLKNSFVSMMVSNDLGARFYDEKARPFFVKMINYLTETSKFPLEKLPIITDNSTSFIASFYKNYETKERKFTFNRNKFLNGGTQMNQPLNTENKLLSIYQAMLTAIHEFRHYEQDYMQSVSKIDDLSPMAIFFAKESIVIREDNNFYKKNHDLFIKEIDATLHANKIMVDFLNSINIKSQDIDRLKRTAKYYFDEGSKSREMYTVRGGFCEVVSADLDEIIKNMVPGKRKMYFDSLPCLTFIYKNDGGKRTYQEIMQLKNTLIQRQKQLCLDQNHINKFIYHVDTIFSVIVNYDRDLRKQRDDGFQAKKMTQEKKAIK